jgi:hypothetical protein
MTSRCFLPQNEQAGSAINSTKGHRADFNDNTKDLIGVIVQNCPVTHGRGPIRWSPADQCCVQRVVPATDQLPSDGFLAREVRWRGSAHTQPVAAQAIDNFAKLFQSAMGPG